jgi:hypothetical protein
VARTWVLVNNCGDLGFWGLLEHKGCYG